MTWIRLMDKKPEFGFPIITRSYGYDGKGDCFEDWRTYSLEFKSYNPPITHWWDGEYNFEHAIKSWNEEKNSCEKEKKSYHTAS